MRALALVALAGCFSKPGPPSAEGPVARVVANAWFSDHYDYGGPHSTPVLASPGMTKDGYSIPTTGVTDGELLLFIGSIDNGDMSAWSLPSGFVPVQQIFFGVDHETYVVAYKFAHEEPATYAAMYQGTNIYSAAATLTLIAIDGAAPAAPIEMHDTVGDPAPVMPMMATAPELTTTSDSSTLIYAAGADWNHFTGATTFEAPDGFTPLAAFGDHGTDDANNWDWTSQMIAYHHQPTAGPVGPVTGTFRGSENGSAWAMLLAIAPAP